MNSHHRLTPYKVKLVGAVWEKGQSPMTVTLQGDYSIRNSARNIYGFGGTSLRKRYAPTGHLFTRTFNAQVVVHQPIVRQVRCAAFIYIVPTTAAGFGKPAQIIQILIIDDTILIAIDAGEITLGWTGWTGLNAVSNQIQLVH
jgi:predicted component of type VI protein secretion system